MADVRLRDLNPAVLDYDLTVAGSVGIGTTSPATTLDIHDSGGTGLRVLRGTVDLRLSDNAANGNVGTESNHNLYIRTNSTDRITITNTGLVGIGAGAPATELQIGDYTDAAETITIATSDNGTGRINFYDNNATEGGSIRVTGASNGSKMHFANRWNTDADKVTFDLINGRVGIVTTAPKRALHIHTSSVASCFLQVTNGSTGSGSDGDGFQFGIGSSGGAQIIQRENLPLAISTNNTERLIISAVGEVGIGTASPGEKLHLVTAGNTRIRIDSGDSSASSVDLYDNGSLGARINCDSSKNLELMAGGRASADMIINTTTGYVGIGTNSPTETLHVNGNLKVTGSVEVGASGFNVSTGFIIAFGVAAPPSGWLACNGSAVSRTTYSDLYALIGTTYGAGNGSTTFNVPDLRGRTLIGTDGLAAGSFTANLGGLDNIGGIGGAQNHTLTTAQIPAHRHGMRTVTTNNNHNALAGRMPEGTDTFSPQHIADVNGLPIHETGGGESHNTVQPSLAISYLIKT